MSDSYDIFVSYAHVDNEVLPGEQNGWVTNLIRTLEIYLRQKMGRRESYSLWRDPELPGNVPLTPEIIDTVKQSELFLLILSPGYQASRWCMQELETFVAKHGVDSSRVFVVEREKPDTPPEAIQDLKGYAFWVADQDSGVMRVLGTPETEACRSEYFKQVGDLAIQMVKCLKSLRETARVSHAAVAPTAVSVEAVDTQNAQYEKTVYLTPVPDTLQIERANMVRFLNQHNIQVLPASNRINLMTYHQELENDLAQCEGFIQLLDSSTNMGFPINQFMVASEREQPLLLLQWRAHTLDMDTVNDPEHKALLQGENVMASDAVEFQHYVLQKLFPPEPQTREQLVPDENDRIIFINAGREDWHLAEKVSQRLSEHGHLCLLPLHPDEETSPAEIRRDMEQSMQECDALLLLYADSPASQIREYVQRSWRIRAKRTRPLPTAICISQDSGSRKLNVVAPNLHLLTCEEPFPADCVDEFLRETAL